MKIYTKSGDKGETSLASGQRVKKCCPRIESYGTADELNSFIGTLVTYTTDTADRDFLTSVQKTLFVVGAYLATEPKEGGYTPDISCLDGLTADTEREIDRLSAMLPQLRCFILPGGVQGAAVAHICRTVCRRLERNIYALKDDGAVVDNSVTAYINRLSDYFFVLARKMNHDNGQDDVRA
ncbi:MAG: cob(I)yrinic acid a,c-diamide adenosyltransferase [Prevotella sp.]